ncbi:MAG: NAD(P)H-binding protein [Thermoleophilaceae bacterium]|nr:NAD(P)H-binding protein [Thermoleophilaceae bacterium]
MELITGATGYVGGRLLERLRSEGRAVRALARDTSRLPDDVEGAQGDLLTGEGLEQALDGCDFAYYLVHSMERADDDDYAARDRLAAENFVTAAQSAGVKRMAYLGGFVPSDATPSSHLGSRLEVEQILLEGLPDSTALRASILIGARSSSFRVLVRLVEKLRVLPFPAWRENRTQPIDERDAISYLAATPSTLAAAGRSLDIAGPDVVTYAGMIERIADHMGVGRVPVRFGLTQTPAASAVVAKIAEQPLELVRPLMESLEHELLPRPEAGAAEVYDNVRLHSFDRAIERSLREWEAAEPLAAR